MDRGRASVQRPRTSEATPAGRPATPPPTRGTQSCPRPAGPQHVIPDARHRREMRCAAADRPSTAAPSLVRLVRPASGPCLENSYLSVLCAKHDFEPRDAGPEPERHRSASEPRGEREHGVIHRRRDPARVRVLPGRVEAAHERESARPVRAGGCSRATAPWLKTGRGRGRAATSTARCTRQFGSWFAACSAR